MWYRCISAPSSLAYRSPGHRLIATLQTSSRRLNARIETQHAAPTRMPISSTIDDLNHNEPEVQQLHSLLTHPTAQATSILMVAKSMPTKVIIEALLKAQEHPQTSRPQWVYAVMRLIDARSDLDQHVYDMVKLQGLFDILSGLQNKGLRPWCDNLVSLALKQVCYPDDIIAMGWEQRAFLLKGLADIFASSQGRARTAPEALLELTFSLTAEIKSKLPSNSYGDPSGFKPYMAIAVSALCKLLVLHHQHDALPGSDVTVSVRSVREALSSSLRELAASCIAYIPNLGPQASADLAEASSVTGGGVTWAMMKAFFVEAGHNHGSDYWDSALAYGISSMCDFITEDSVLQHLESQFELLFIARSQRGSCTSFLGITAELLMETRCQGRDLAGRGSQALVVAASRAAFHAHSKGLCLIDTLATSARCLGEAGLLTGDLQRTLGVISLEANGLSLNGCINSLIACNLSSSHDKPSERVLTLVRHAKSQLTSLQTPLEHCSPRVMWSLFLSSSDEDVKFFGLTNMVSQLDPHSRNPYPSSSLLVVKSLIDNPLPLPGEIYGQAMDAHQRINAISALSLGILHLMEPSLIVQLLSHIASLHTGSRLMISHSLSMEEEDGVPESLALLGTGILNHLDTFGPEELVSLSSSIARLGWRPGLLIQGICQRLVRRLHKLESGKALELLWSLSTLNVKKSITNSIASSCLSRATNDGGYTPDQLSTLVWCCGRLRFRDDTLLKPVLQLLLRSDAELRIRAVSSVVWSCARLGYATERLSSWAVGHLKGGSVFASSSPQTLSNIAWGLSRLGHQPQVQVIKAIIESARLHLDGSTETSLSQSTAPKRSQGFKPKELSALMSALSFWRAYPGSAFLELIEDHLFTGFLKYDTEAVVGIMWSMVSLGHKPSTDLFDRSSARVESILHDAGRLDDKLVCNFLMACYRCGHRPAGLLKLFSVNLSLRLNEKSVQGINAVNEDSSADPNSTSVAKHTLFPGAGIQKLPRHGGLVDAVFALSLHRCHDPALFQHVELNAIRLQGSMTPAQLSRILHAFALVRALPALWLRRGLIPTLETALPTMNLAQVARCASALGSWRHRTHSTHLNLLLQDHLLPSVSIAVQSQGSSPSPTVILFLLKGLASLNLYDEKTVDKILTWVTGTTEVESPILPPSVPVSSRLTVGALCDLLWAMARLKHDHPAAMQGLTSTIFERIIVNDKQTKIDECGAVDTRQFSRAPALRADDMANLFWSWAKFNRHPGSLIIDEASRQWEKSNSSPANHELGMSSTTDVDKLTEPISLNSLCTLIYSLSILKEHSHPLFRQASTMLANSLISLDKEPQRGNLIDQDSYEVPPSFHQQLPQVAAALLLAQADKCPSSFLNKMLGPTVKALAIDVWREKILKKAASRPKRQQYEVASACRRLGLQASHGAISSDGIVCPDVLVTLPDFQEARFAIEMVGKHNTSTIGQRVLGEATVKFRLLQARGYIVVPISCKEWDGLNGDARALYVQQKIDDRLGSAASSARRQKRPTVLMPAEATGIEKSELILKRPLHDSQSTDSLHDDSNKSKSYLTDMLEDMADSIDEDN